MAHVYKRRKKKREWKELGKDLATYRRFWNHEKNDKGEEGLESVRGI